MAGASGYVLKEVGSGDLLADIRRVSQGMSLLDPGLTQELMDRLRKDQEAESRLTVLTPQERRGARAASPSGSRTDRSPSSSSWPRPPSRTTSPACSPSWACAGAPRRPSMRQCWWSGRRAGLVPPPLRSAERLTGAPAGGRGPQYRPWSRPSTDGEVAGRRERAEVHAGLAKEPLEAVALGEGVHEV